MTTRHRSWLAAFRAASSRSAPPPARGAPTSRWPPPSPMAWCCASSTPAGTETRVPLLDYDAGVWHGFVPGVGPGQAYGYRTTGPYDPARGDPLQPGQVADRPLRPSHHRVGSLRSRGLRLRRGQTPTAASGLDSAGSYPAAWSSTRAFAWSDAAPAPSSLRRHGDLRSARQGVHDDPPRTSRRSCGAPTPGSATTPPSPTWSNWGSPRWSCSRSIRACPSPSCSTGA